MNGFRTLLRLTVINRLSALRPGNYRRENGKLDANKIAQAVAAVIGIAVLLGMVIFLELMLYRGLAFLNHPELLPAMGLMVSMAGMVLMSFFYVLGSLYFSRDAVWMSYLPVSSRTVLTAKLTEIWAGEALIDLAMLMPAIVMYGMHIAADPLYYVRGVVIALLAPMLPLAIITVLSTALAGVIGRMKNSAILTTALSMVLVLGVVILEMTVISRVPEEADALWIMRMLLDREALLQTLTGIFPPVQWGIAGLRGNWGMMALFCAVSVGSLALVALVLGKPYLGLCVRQSEQSSSGVKTRITGDTWRVSSPLKALYQMEVRDILRSSTYLTQCMAGALVYPLLFAMMMFGGSVSEELGMMKDAMLAMAAEVPVLDMTLIIAAVFALVMFISPAAPTAVSREGARHAMNRTLPIAPRTFLRAKLLCAATIDALVCLVMVVITAAGLRLQPGIFLGAVALAALCRYGSLTLMLLVDTLRPVLQWKNETQAIKSNMNVLFGMLVCLVLLALPVVAGVLMLLAECDATLRFAAVCGIVLLEAVIGGVLLHTVAVKRYAAIEP